MEKVLTLEDIREKLKNYLLSTELPGQNAQFKMAPAIRIKELESLDVEKLSPPRESAVLILIYPHDKLNIVLIQRSGYDGVHSSQISFPGGKRETTDLDLQETAVRETYEEVGINTKNIEIIGKLTSLYIPPSNFMVYPYIGILNEEPNFKPDIREVHRIIELPLYALLTEEIKGEAEITTSYAEFSDVPCYKYDNAVIWGATAMIISELEYILKDILQ
ncbi:MAG: CoA pyrophosphatase [Hyphomicrobiales bacterium]